MSMRMTQETLFTGGSDGKESAAMQEIWAQSLGQEDCLDRKWQPLQHSCLENAMDRGAWWPIGHGVTKSQI